MSKISQYVAVLLLLAALIGAGVLTLLVRHGFSARDEPWGVEAFVARRLRLLAIPAAAREMNNPIALTSEIVADGRAHFADHCASCHANDGSGQTSLGRNLYPPAPDMRKQRTQSLTDGELFYIIHNGIRFTGMPAWGGQDADEDAESWKLVHFIRYLPEINEDELAEMEKLNPKSRKEVEEEEAMRKFLEGGRFEEPHSGHQH